MIDRRDDRAEPVGGGVIPRAVLSTRWVANVGAACLGLGALALMAAFAFPEWGIVLFAAAGTLLVLGAGMAFGAAASRRRELAVGYNRDSP